ncbi:MAG: protein phosphatase 2C domain-containing protein [Clostridia bacterium]|nr:protein phosphatase 2C domain-containing protein [Clostridia bacterium]
MMNYSVFSAYARGYAHVREDMVCQDFADHYIDPEGKYAIAVACDGHSDKNCFRSDRGARFGCEAVKYVLNGFLENYVPGSEENKRAFLRKEDALLQTGDKIRRLILSKWAKLVQDDLNADPVTEDEMRKVSPSVKEMYRAGQHTRDIYGATMQAVAVCDDFHLALQVGDGLCLALYPDGAWDEILEEDEKGQYGGPASLCDMDLLTRPRAFRIRFIPGRPLGMFATSDGMGDLDRLNLIASLQELQKRLYRPEMTGMDHIPEDAKKYLQSMTEYFADKDHGPEDDCSLAGFVASDSPAEEIRLWKQEAEAVLERVTDMIRETEKLMQFYSLEKLQSLKSQVQAMEGERQSIQDQKKRLEQRIHNLKENIRSLEAEISALDRRENNLALELREKEQSIRRINERGQAEEQMAVLQQQKELAIEYLRSSREQWGEPLRCGVLFEDAQETSHEETGRKDTEVPVIDSLDKTGEAANDEKTDEVPEESPQPDQETAGEKESLVTPAETGTQATDDGQQPAQLDATQAAAQGISGDQESAGEDADHGAPEGQGEMSQGGKAQEESQEGGVKKVEETCRTPQTEETNPFVVPEDQLLQP